MKVTIDPDRCVGQGMCVLYAPKVFQLGDEDGRAELLVAQIPPEQEDAVIQAERACPEQAITIIREKGSIVP
ncbi:ferredoxin [Novosphingobium rosa]|uniref:ferredoxin n=1 Tax=Novosphingobium rosa TaxID=76978 RepID=UPI000829D1E3|nr:ferredoxin [Novosphingobium rosa]